MKNMEKTTAHVVSCNSPLMDEDFVGFERDVAHIIQKLTGLAGRKEQEVISIFGMAGLGKTTLALKAYNNSSVVDHFDVRAFCAVSQNYDLRKLAVEILKQATGEKRDINEDKDAVGDLKKALCGKRYLIVLDDIWNIEAWDDLRLCFPTEQKRGRIIVTTRFENVANEFSDPYSLRFLNDEESWELLQKKAFQSKKCPSELCKAGQEVARSCKGLPLVIVLIAGIVSQKERDASVWLEFAKEMSSHGLEELSTEVIQSSYDILGDRLKHCLLYMGLFPEDRKVEVSDLLKLWVAEDFVQSVDTEDLEKASKDCFNDLINRSLLIVSKRKSNGDIKYCMVHDLVREFCSLKLKKETFRQHISYQPSYSKEPRSCMYINDMLVREMEVNNFLLEEIQMLDLKEKKSLEFVAHPQFYASNPMDLFHLLTNLKLIRVLHLLDMESAWEFQSSPGSVLKSLTHLRYLAIFVKKFDFKWVAHLGNLQTLRVHSQVRIKTSPAIWSMTQLRHVDVSEFSFIWEDNNEQAVSFNESSQPKLENLKTFGKCRLSVADMNRNFWWRFPNLEEIRLSIVNIHDMPTYSPENDNHLHSLDISFPTGFSTSAGRFKPVFPLNLKVLSLAGISLTEDIVSSIAALENLERLKLFFIHFACEPHCWDVKDDQEFKALKYLKLEQVNMNEWHSSDASFPKLEKLVIKDCELLEEIPSSFQDILSLELIKVINCSDSVGKSALGIKEEAESYQGNDRIQVYIPKNY